MDDVFFHRSIFHGTPIIKTCADCGALGIPNWIEITSFTEQLGEHRFIQGEGFSCPNGPHEVNEEARRG